MRHYMVDPDNEERLLKVPPHVVAAIKAEAFAEAVEAVVNCDDYHSATNMLLVDAYREGLQAAREAIEALGAER